MLDKKPASASFVSKPTEDPYALLIGNLHCLKLCVIGHNRIQFLLIREHTEKALVILIKTKRVYAEKEINNALIRS